MLVAFMLLWFIPPPCPSAKPGVPAMRVAAMLGVCMIPSPSGPPFGCRCLVSSSWPRFDLSRGDDCSAGCCCCCCCCEVARLSGEGEKSFVAVADTSASLRSRYSRNLEGFTVTLGVNVVLRLGLGLACCRMLDCTHTGVNTHTHTHTHTKKRQNCQPTFCSEPTRFSTHPALARNLT